MAEIIKMPALSDTMEVGVVAAWHKKVGDAVESGELLAEIETDKATMDLESFFDGHLLYIGTPEGGAIPVGQLLAIIGEKGEDISAILAAEEDTGDKEAAEEQEAEVETHTTEVVEQPAVSAEQLAASMTPEGRIKASPLAKAMAKAKGIDLRFVVGTGENGRIIKRDIEKYLPTKEVVQPVEPKVQTPVQKPATPLVQKPQTVVSAPPAAEGTYEDVRVSQMRSTIARRLSESKYSAPHFYLTMEINMDKVVTTRKALNEVSPSKISFNDIVIKAAALALRKHPKVNASWLGDKIRYHKQIHIGMAVAVDEGLIVPVIRLVDTKGLSTIAAESRELAGKARDRKLVPSDYQGNTFTISNLGMFGIEEFTAIINPPDACILAVGAIIQKPIVKDGAIVPGSMMKVTLSCDHRVVDGAMGSRFLQTFKQLLEDPMRMLM